MKTEYEILAPRTQWSLKSLQESPRTCLIYANEAIYSMRVFANQQTLDLRKKLDYQTERCKAAERYIETFRVNPDGIYGILQVQSRGIRKAEWQSLVNKESEIYNNE